MLRRLLRLAAERGSMDVRQLAAVLGTGPDLVEQMLEQLQRQGYVQAVVDGCGGPCERCPLRSACLYRRHPRVWSLTAKGEALLQKAGR